MSSASAHGSSGDKLDTELNLVPFIDLLSTLVLFLLLTAVWVQVAAIEASVDSKGKSAASVSEQSKLLVHVTKDSLQLTWPSSYAGGAMPASAANLAQLLSIVAPLVKAGHIPPAVVSGDDAVEYGAVVQALDTLKSAGFAAIGLGTD